MRSSLLVVACASAFVAPTAPQRSTALRGWFDGKDDAKNDDWKDEMMREQKEILSRRQDKDKTRDYFKKVDEKRVQAQKEQVDRWAFQRDPTADPLIAWKTASCGRDDLREILTGKTMRNRHRRAW